MKTDKSRHTLANVIERLKDKSHTHAVQKKLISGQELLIANNNIVWGSQPKHEPHLKTKADRLSRMLNDMSLKEEDEINHQALSYKKRTALIHAVIADEHDIVKALLDHGADPSVCDINGNNALMHAAKKGRAGILKEFLMLIKKSTAPKNVVVAQAKEESKTIAPKNSASTQPIAEAAIEPARPNPKTENNSLRVSLDSSVLHHKNNQGFTVEEIMLQFKQKNSQAFSNSAADSPRTTESKTAPTIPSVAPMKTLTQTNDPLDRLKKLTEDLHIINQHHAQLENPMPKKEPKASLPKPIEIKPQTQTASRTNSLRDEASTSQYAAARKKYDGFFTKKFGFFSEKTNQAALSDPAKIEKARQREQIFKIRKNHHAPTLALPQEPLPAHPQDQACAQAAIALLKDYHARPFLHWFRRYGNKARDLVKALEAISLETVEGIMAVHNMINQEKLLIKELPHDHKEKNNICNSSYLRRLNYISNQLQKTHAYEQVTYGLDDDTYLKSLNMLYVANYLL